MWIVPVSVSPSAQFDDEWTSEAGNELFVLQAWNGSNFLLNLGLTRNDHRYRILWKHCHELFIIATSKSRNDISGEWEWLIGNVVETAVAENIDPEARDLAVESRLMDVLPYDEQQALSAGIERRLAKVFGTDEALVAHTRASFLGQKGILALGTFRILFYSDDADSDNGGYTVHLPYGQVEDLWVVGGNIFSKSSLLLRTKQDEHKFTALDPTSAQSICSTILEMRAVAMRAIISGQSLPASPSKSGLKSRSRTGSGIIVEETLKADISRHLFKLPLNTHHIGTYSVAKFTFSHSSFSNCQVHLYSNYLCFRGGALFSMALPLGMISSAHKSSSHAIEIFLYNKAIIYLFKASRGLYSAVTHQLRPTEDRPTTGASIECPDSVFRPLASTGNDHCIKEWWDGSLKELYISDESNATIIVTEKMRQMIWRYGIPNEIRPMLWPLLAGLADNRVPDSLKDKYMSELRLAEQEIQASAIEEIDRDLQRSLPDHPAFNQDAGLAALRRLLIICSHRLGHNGYTQAMNMIGAVLLLSCAEAVAVEVMTKCITEWMPDTFSRSMLGGAIDQRVFEEALITHIPALENVTCSDTASVSSVSFGWFVAWFANVLSAECELRFFDVFLLEGPVAVYWFGMAVFETSLKRCAAADPESIVLAVNHLFVQMKSDRDLFDQMLYDAFGSFSSRFTPEDMLRLRRRHSHKVLQLLSDRTRDSDLKRLARISSLSFDDVALVYDAAIAAISRNPSTSIHAIDVETFKAVSRQLIPWTVYFGVRISEQLFAYYATDMPTMSMDVLVRCVHETTMTSPREQAVLYCTIVGIIDESSVSSFIRQSGHLFAQSAKVNILL